MKRSEPSFGVALAMSLVPLVTIGAFAGIEGRDGSRAIVATTLVIVAVVHLLGPRPLRRERG